MPRIPKLCRHKAQALAYVTLGGRQIYLGSWPAGKPASKEVRTAYDRKILEWLSLRRETPTPIVGRNPSAGKRKSTECKGP